MKSIMHRKSDGTCYLCMMLHGDSSQKSPLQEHHVIYGTANRKLSEKYGLKIYLCQHHHIYGPEAVHLNKEIALMTKQDAQLEFEKKWPELSFLEIFGKNYLEKEEKNEKSKHN